MKLKEIILHGQEHGDGVKFVAEPNQGIKEEIVFEVLDAHFEMITYTGSNGFMTLSMAEELGLHEKEFKLLESGDSINE